MKKNIYFIALYLFAQTMIGCKENETITPKSSFVASSLNLNVNESVEFTFNGTALKISIFTGDDNHNYDSINSGNTGFVVNKGTFNYAYRHPGRYKVVIIASANNENAEILLHDTSSVYVNVVDTNSTIQSVSCPKVFYDQIAAEIVGNDWLVCLPQKIFFKAQTLTVSSKQRLSIKLASDSATLTINNQTFSSTTSYELKNTNILTVKPYQSDVRNYNLYMLFYPEFKIFTLSGVAGTLIRNEYNYDQMQMTVALPTGTDVSTLIPEFTLSQGQNVYINGILQISGTSVVDFSSPVVYELTNTNPDNTNLVAKTQITITVTH